MNKVLLALLTIVVVFGLISATGYAGYRLGFAQGMEQRATGAGPDVRPFERMGPGRMPMHEFGFGRGFHRGFDGSPLWIFGFVSLFGLLWRVAIIALIVWFAYWLVTQSGWRLIRTAQTVESQPAPSIPEPKESKNGLED